MKKKTFIISFLLIFSLFCTGLSASAFYTPSFALDSEAICMINMDTGMVVFEKNSTVRRSPASLTKIMTAIIALELTPDLDEEKVTCKDIYSAEFQGWTGLSHAWISNGEIMTMRSLLYCMMLPSANEAAASVADHITDGDRPAFIRLMNQKAEDLGCTDTHFVNPHGLYDENQYTTARDMVIIAKYAMDTYPVLREIVSTQSYLLPATNKRGEGWISNSNKLLSPTGGYYYEYACGVKTGTLPQAGRCLVSMATKGGYSYMIALLGGPYKDENGVNYPTRYDMQETIKLYNWAFSSLDVRQIIESGETVAQVNVSHASGQDIVRLVPNSDFTLLLPDDVEPSNVQRVVTLTEETIDAPVKKGEVLGYMTFQLQGQEVGRVNLVAAESVERNNVLYYLEVAKEIVTSASFLVTSGILGLLIVVYIIYNIIMNKKRRRMKQLSRRKPF